MQASVNGHMRKIESGTTVAQLVVELGLEGRRLAVELNGSILPRSRHPVTRIHEGDLIEIVHAIGGGSPKS